MRASHVGSELLLGPTIVPLSSRRGCHASIDLHRKQQWATAWANLRLHFATPCACRCAETLPATLARRPTMLTPSHCHRAGVPLEPGGDLQIRAGSYDVTSASSASCVGLAPAGRTGALLQRNWRGYCAEQRETALRYAVPVCHERMRAMIGHR